MFQPHSWLRSRGWKARPTLQLLWAIESAGTPRLQGNRPGAGSRTAHHDILVSLLIEVMEVIPNEDKILLLVPQAICQHIPGTMRDALTHSLLCEDRF
jgi:hypothetical protein